MAYKDKEKQKQASKEAMRRYRKRKKGITQLSDTVIPIAPDVRTMIDNAQACGTGMMLIQGKPQAQDPNVQAIWDRRNAQGQAAAYSSEAMPEDYPQTQRPMR